MSDYELSIRLTSRARGMFLAAWKLKGSGISERNDRIPTDRDYFVEAYLEGLLGDLSNEVPNLDPRTVPINFDLRLISRDDRDLVADHINAIYGDDPDVTYTR